MRLLFISAAFPPMRAGESEHAYYQCRHLSSRGGEVHLLTSRANRGLPGMPLRCIRSCGIRHGVICPGLRHFCVGIDRMRSC